MSKDKDNVIPFPGTKVDTKDTIDKLNDELLMQKEEVEMIESTIDEVAIDLIRRLVDIGIDINKKEFYGDLAMITELVRGLIYRDFNMAHAAQLMANKMVAIKFTRGGKASAARIDYSSFMKKSPNKQVFNKEFKEELNDLQDGSDMFESDMDLNGDDDKK